MINLERNEDALRKIAAKFRLLRRKAELKQKDVAKETGLNIGNIEAARINLNLTSLEVLCRYYGLTLEEFFDDIDL